MKAHFGSQHAASWVDSTTIVITPKAASIKALKQTIELLENELARRIKGDGQ